MTQDHLVIDFPIRGPPNAKALTDELPPLMPDLARVQDDLGTVHFSRFMVEGDEKLLFLSDIDGEGAQHVERLVDSAGPVLTPSSSMWIDPPATPVADNREEVVRWLRDHVRAPLDMYFAYGDASVQDIKACAREAGFTGNTLQSPLLTYMTIKSRLQGVALKFDTQGYQGHGDMRPRTLSGRCILPLGTLRQGASRLLHDLRRRHGRSTSRTSPTRTSFVFDSVFPHVVGAPPTPIAEERPAHSISGGWTTTIHQSGSTAPIQASRFKTSEPCWPIASRNPPPPEQHRCGTGCEEPRVCSPTAWTAGSPREQWRVEGRGSIGARPRGHTGVRSPRVHDADGAALLVEGRRLRHRRAGNSGDW